MFYIVPETDAVSSSCFLCTWHLLTRVNNNLGNITSTADKVSTQRASMFDVLLVVLYRDTPGFFGMNQLATKVFAIWITGNS